MTLEFVDVFTVHTRPTERDARSVHCPKCQAQAKRGCWDAERKRTRSKAHADRYLYARIVNEARLDRSRRQEP